jgi:hypothetical protein
VWNQGYAEAVTGVNYFDKIKDIPNVRMIELDFEKMGIGHIPDVFRSDILRLQLLGTEGGLWSDQDIIYFRPMDEMCFNTPGESNIDTVVSYSPVRNHFSIGFLMACAGNPFYHFLYQHALESKKQDGEYQHLGITLWHKYFANAESIQNSYRHLRVYDIQMFLTYFLNSFDSEQIVNQNVPLTDSRTIAFHWYGGHPKIIPWESKLTPNNLDDFNNTLVTTIKRALNG